MSPSQAVAENLFLDIPKPQTILTFTNREIRSALPRPYYYSIKPNQFIITKMSTSNDDANRKLAADATDQPNTKKRKSDQFKGEFWSLGSDDDKDPFSDLVVVVKSESNEEEEEERNVTIYGYYHVHRSKLGRNSAFFDRLLRGGFAESNTSDHVDLFLHPKVAPHFATILDFMYGGWEPKELSHASVAVANIADYLEIPGIYDKIMDQIQEIKETSDMSLVNEYMGYAKVLGMTDLKTRLVKCVTGFEYELEWFEWMLYSYYPSDLRCPSIELMEACLDHIGDGLIVNKNSLLILVDAFLFCTDVDDIPKNIYDRLVEQPAGDWSGEEVVVFGHWKKIPTKVLILREKFYPSSTTTVPLTSVEKKCVSKIVKKLNDVNKVDQQMKLIEGLSTRILSIICCVSNGSNVNRF